jgi:hypothetical protein
MPTQLFTAQTANGASGASVSQGRYATLMAKGTWGGAVITVEVSPDGGTNWITSTVQLTSNGVVNFIAGRGVTYRLALTSATTTNLNAWLAYEL